jgi:hypothetical protein
MLRKLIPEGVDRIVTALCLDYERRAEAIRHRSVGRRTEMQYRYFNYQLYRAACEIAGEDDALLYIDEIGSCTGYANTELTSVSETTYKKIKSEVKLNIARALCLID